MIETTIAQIVLNGGPEYLDYDFVDRKERRRINGGMFLNQVICRRNLLDVKRVLDKHNIKFWLVYGTLLGAIREGNFILHDTDTDLGIYDQDRAAFVAALRDLLGLGFELIRTKTPDDLVTIMRDDEYIDFGLFRIEKDERGRNYYVYQNNREYGPVFDSLTRYSFLGTEFLIPAETKQLLKRWYGPEWHKPKTGSPAMQYGYSKLKRFFYKFTIVQSIRVFYRKYLK